MLMMIDNRISSCINKESIDFLHSWTWQLIHLTSAMNYDYNIVRTSFCFFDGIKLLYRIQRICSTMDICDN